MVFWNAKVMKSLEPVISGDHPLSLGYQTYLVTRNRAFEREVRCTKEQFDSCFRGHSGNFSAMHAVFDEQRVVILAFREPEHEGSMNLSRLVELIVHECNHYVDDMFKRTQVEACTELRSYYLDWVVGAVCRRVPALCKKI